MSLFSNSKQQTFTHRNTYSTTKNQKNMKQHIKEKYKFKLEMVPPGCHQCNAAKVAIRNFKAHFLSILTGMADSFSLHLWDRLLPQTEITLNLRRQSNATVTVSAYAHLSGPFNYNKMPLAPMGCEVQIHKKQTNTALGRTIQWTDGI